MTQIQLKIKVNDNLQTQGCSRILHPLIHGLTGNTCGNFTPVVILKYCTTGRISAIVFCGTISEKCHCIFDKKVYVITGHSQALDTVHICFCGGNLINLIVREMVSVISLIFVAFSAISLKFNTSFLSDPKILQISDLSFRFRLNAAISANSS